MNAQEPNQKTQPASESESDTGRASNVGMKDRSAGIFLFIAVALGVGFLRTLNPFVGLMAAFVFIVAVFVLMNRGDGCS